MQEAHGTAAQSLHGLLISQGCCLRDKAEAIRYPTLRPYKSFPGSHGRKHVAIVSIRQEPTCSKYSNTGLGPIKSVEMRRRTLKRREGCALQQRWKSMGRKYRCSHVSTWGRPRQRQQSWGESELTAEAPRSGDSLDPW